MKRIQEKVKDIVDVRPFASLRDFTADPAETLEHYHFTDFTSDLMSNWLASVAAVRAGSGASRALAGFRGVGKSHFLAALAAIVGEPDLRASISDAHVAAAAERLLRRHYPVVRVKRGTFGTLREELQNAVASAIGVDITSVGSSAEDILDLAVSRSGDLPLILVIDTALERGERVSRDDGGLLSELAEAARSRNVFMAVALDDDISGADGANAGISKTFVIDYLDQEHLYKVVNGFVFPKHAQMQPALHDVYTYFREVMPDFRWSEQRFASLYPLHPAILEAAPFVRLHVHDFALLSFASTAGERILGRPANSLIALDEVFDSAERALRTINELADAFAAYDDLNANVVSKIPVMNRLQAKLVLKALLILSLNGGGATAGELCAGILIFDEGDTEKSVRDVRQLVASFAEASTGVDGVPDGGDIRYSFRVSSRDSLNLALARSIESAPDDLIQRIMLRELAERFSDLPFDADAEASGPLSEPALLAWRGSFRRGSVVWRDFMQQSNIGESVAGDDEWRVLIEFNGDAPAPERASESDPSAILWLPDPLRLDEVETIRKFHALNTDNDLRGEFSEQIGATVHAHKLLVGRIFARSFFDDAKLVIEGFDYNFTEEAKSAATFSKAFSIMLEPLFETRFPDHPIFPSPLTDAAVDALVADLYSGNRQYLPEVQSLARTFALPLGLVRDQGGTFLPQNEEGLIELPLAKAVLALVDSGPAESVALKDIADELGKPPVGLVREAQRLLLAALVAGRQLDFVTAKGERISRRSLDLRLNWDDIAGVARPVESSYSAKRLNRWGAHFAGTSGFRSLDDLADREMLRSAFLKWTAEWRRARILEKFEALPDHQINARMWNMGALVAKTLGSVFENISACLDNSITYEECLSRISDTFLDDTAQVAAREAELVVIDSFVGALAKRSEIETYLALCEPTGSNELETLRERLLDRAERATLEPDEQTNRELGYLWAKFLREYTDQYTSLHDATMRSRELTEEFRRLKRSDEWWQYQNLKAIRPVVFEEWPEIDDALAAGAGCERDVRAMLASRPSCICAFSMLDAELRSELPKYAADALREGALRGRRTLRENAVPLRQALDEVTGRLGGDSAAAAKSRVSEWLELTGDDPLTPVEFHLLREAALRAFPDDAAVNPGRLATSPRLAGAHDQ